ncbi:hypothetical protein D3C86_2084700 [compost metagenome]
MGVGVGGVGADELDLAQVAEFDIGNVLQFTADHEVKKLLVAHGVEFPARKLSLGQVDMPDA